VNLFRGQKAKVKVTFFYIFWTGRSTNFKRGTMMEHEDPYHRQGPWPLRLKVARSRDAYDMCWPQLHKSRTKSPRNTKIGRKVDHPTGNNARHVRGKKSKAKVTASINAETENMSPIRTSNLVGGWSTYMHIPNFRWSSTLHGLQATAYTNCADYGRSDPLSAKKSHLSWYPRLCWRD